MFDFLDIYGIMLVLRLSLWRRCLSGAYFVLSHVDMYSVVEVGYMTVSYKKLWKLLIDRDLKKKDLEHMANVSHYTMNKLTHGDNVTTDVLGRICKSLDCSLDDIMEFTND